MSGATTAKDPNEPADYLSLSLNAGDDEFEDPNIGSGAR